MLKGILFVIAIIVTFDIGKTLIEQRDVELEEGEAQEVLEQAGEEASESESMADKESSLQQEQSNKPALDLSLPEGAGKHDDGDEAKDEDSSGKDNLFQGSGNGSSQKSMSLKTRPIMEFDKQERKPDVSGIKLELKKDL